MERLYKFPKGFPMTFMRDSCKFLKRKTMASMRGSSSSLKISPPLANHTAFMKDSTIYAKELHVSSGRQLAIPMKEIYGCHEIYSFSSYAFLRRQPAVCIKGSHDFHTESVYVISSPHGLNVVSMKGSCSNRRRDPLTF
jgi:hypothetical protein